MDVFWIIVFVVSMIFVYLCNTTGSSTPGSTLNRKYDNYTPPKGYKTDWEAANKDLVASGFDRKKIMQNTINGKYLVPDNKEVK